MSELDSGLTALQKEVGHTPGPWSIVEYGDGDSLAIHHSDTDRVCFMATHGGSLKAWDAIQANARLIAAAPDLYDALEPFAALLQSHHARMDDRIPAFAINDALVTYGDLRAATSAIAKARKGLTPCP